MSHEIEHGFGTGLRAQLRRKQGEPETEIVESAEVTGGEELSVVVESGFERFDEQVPVIVQATVPELAELRAELEDALRREQGLREALQHHVEAHERELDAGRDLALREAETEQWAARMSTRESELAERERLLAEKLEQVAHERRELNLHRTEIVAEEARLAELGIQVDARATDLDSADQGRAQEAAELAKRLALVAERERELKRERLGLDQRRAEAIAKEDALRTREEAAGARERDLRAAELDSERTRTRLQERVEAVATRETETEARLSKLELELAGRETAIATWEERVRSQAERAERERAGHGRASQEAFALMAELERLEEALKLREAQVAQATVSRDTDSRQTQAREQLVARGEVQLATVRDELDHRAEETEKLELELARRATELEDKTNELRLREARLGAELELQAEKLEQFAETLDERDRRLSDRERDLATYVGELQRTVA